MTEFNGLNNANTIFQYATGYRMYDERHAQLMATSQPASQFTFNNIDPRTIKPIGVIDWIQIEDQLRLGSCAGQAASSIIELCLWLQSKGRITTQLSRMFAYINGQRRDGISGDNGATLEGVIRGLREDGLPEEPYMPYTGNYYTSIPRAAMEDAQKRRLRSHSPIRQLQEAYEAIARRVGGIFLGIPCTQEIFNSGPDGKLDYYQPQRVGGHAICIVDVCEETDERGWPYFLSPGSWSKKYGYRGFRKIRPSVLATMLNYELTSCYLLSEMEFTKPRYDWENTKWAA